MRLLTTILLLLSGWFLAISAHGDVPLPSTPGTTIIGTTFATQPVESGLSFNRTGVRAANVDLHGSTTEAWQAVAGSDAASPNFRTFRFKVTDLRFLSGALPVVDVVVTYYAPGPMGVDFKAETYCGIQTVGSGRGKGTDFVTVTIPLQDAAFGARANAGDTKPASADLDLVVTTRNGDLYLREVHLVGYDRKTTIDWTHLLRLEQVTSNGPGGVLLFAQGSPVRIHLALKNDALVDLPVRHHFQISNADDKVVAQGDGKVTLLANSGQDVTLAFDAGVLPLGPYEARCEIFADNNSPVPLLSRTFQIGITDAQVLEKARPGEFLYGLDPANNSQYLTHSPLALAYYRLMGVDILRNLWEKGMPMTPDNAGIALADLAKENVQSAIIIDPPKDKNPDALARSMVKTDVFLSELARRYAGFGPGRLHYYELGNEPDLRFFYPGTMAEYLTAFYSMRQAIKDGAAKGGFSDKDTVVYNGGLAFVHPEGGRNSRELLALVDPAKIDAIAYHGHGPGISAERNAWERVHSTLVQDKKEGLVQIETESGVMGSDREGSLVQARTVVEKMVYAQSTGAPTLMFFRLFMGGGEAAYSMTENLTEPRPSVLSYRALVERLRHFRFIKTLDLAGKSKTHDCDGFLFAEQDNKGAWTGRKTVVAFCEKPHTSDARIRMAPPEAVIRDVAAYDLFGNRSVVENVVGNVAPLSAGADPVYLTWSSPGPPDEVQAAQAPIQVESLEPVLVDATTMTELSVANPEPKPIEATLTIQSAARLPLSVRPETKQFTLPANDAVRIPVALTAGKTDDVLRLPRYWRVFIDADPSSASTLAAIPETLPGKSGPSGAQSAWAPDGHIDFAQLAGGFEPRRCAVACAYLDAPKAMSIACAASADWWMTWSVNGKKVCDTLAAGNQGATHPFALPLKAGRNLITVMVLAGKLGWGLDYFGPKEVAIQNGSDPDRLSLTLTGDDRTLAQQTVPLVLEESLPTLGPAENPSLLETWLPLEPLLELGSSAVKNLWFQEPDQSRWYKGEKDLGASAWLRDDGRNLQFYVAVADDKLVQAATPADLEKSDSLRVVLADDGGKVLLDLTCGLVANQTVSTGNLAGAICQVQRREDRGETLYLVTIPKAVVGENPFRLNFSVADNDDGYLKQTLEQGDVLKPRDGMRLKSP